MVPPESSMNLGAAESRLFRTISSSSFLIKQAMGIIFIDCLHKTRPEEAIIFDKNKLTLV